MASNSSSPPSSSRCWVSGPTAAWGTAPLFLIVGFVFGAAGTYANQYYRYRARSEINDEGKPWSRSTSKPTSDTTSRSGGAR